MITPLQHRLLPQQLRLKGSEVSRPYSPMDEPHMKAAMARIEKQGQERKAAEEATEVLASIWKQALIKRPHTGETHFVITDPQGYHLIAIALDAPKQGFLNVLFYPATGLPMAQGHPNGRPFELDIRDDRPSHRFFHTEPDDPEGPDWAYFPLPPRMTPDMTAVVERIANQQETHPEGCFVTLPSNHTHQVCPLAQTLPEQPDLISL